MADCTRRGQVHALQRRLHGQRVHHGRQHAHVIGGGAVDALGGARQTAKDIAAADDHADLRAERGGCACTSLAMRSSEPMSMP